MTKAKKAALAEPAALDSPRFGDLVTLWAIRPLPAYHNAVGFVSVDKSQVAAVIASGAAVDPNKVFPLPFIEGTQPDPDPDPDPEPEPTPEDPVQDEPEQDTADNFPPDDR